jgi:hypothetical protein
MNPIRSLSATIFILLSTLVLALPISFGAEMPQGIQTLIDKRQDAIGKIDKMFIQELEKVKIAYVKAGDLEKANLAAELIKNTSRSRDNEAFSLDGEWRHRNDGDDRSVVRRFKGKKLIDEHGVEHRFVFENDGITITWDSHQFEKIIIDRGNPDVMKGVNSQGARFTYTRIK